MAPLLASVAVAVCTASGGLVMLRRWFRRKPDGDLRGAHISRTLTPRAVPVACNFDLGQLQDEMLLAILAFLGVEALARLERSCLRFGVGHSAEPAPLPERAAQLSTVRLAAGGGRQLEKRDGESWKALMLLMECGFLAEGVLHGFPLENLERTGWQLAYQARYDHRTRDHHLEKVPAEARYVFVGARKSLQSREFALAAWGTRSTVLRVTHGDEFWGHRTKSENLEHGVYWYRWEGNSFGFSSHPDLWLMLADCAIKLIGIEECSDDRLSWNLEFRSTGGWRAGREVDLGQEPKEWQKCLYYRM